MTTRFQIRKATHGGWYVYDDATGAMWPGLTYAGALQLADRFNRRNS